MNKESVINSEIVNEKYRIRFILNPACASLGVNKVKPEDLQCFGLDILLRKYCYYKLKYRYKLLRERGFITKKKFKSN